MGNSDGVGDDDGGVTGREKQRLRGGDCVCEGRGTDARNRGGLIWICAALGVWRNDDHGEGGEAEEAAEEEGDGDDKTGY